MIRDICTKPVVTLAATATVAEAARLMRDKRVGTVVITRSTKPVGILTDRDITVSVVAEGKDPEVVPVAEVMHRSPTVIDQDQGVFEAARTFSEQGVRRLPVVDRAGELVGILSLDDLLMLLGVEMGHVARTLSKELGRPIAA